VSRIIRINIDKIANRRLAIFRRELDKQLRKIVFIQNIVSLLTISPCVIIYFVSFIPILTRNSIIVSQLQFASSISSAIYYLYFSVSIFVFK